MGSFYSLHKAYFVEVIDASEDKAYSKSKAYAGYELSGINNMVITPYVKEVVLDKSGFNKLNELLTSSNTSQLQRSLLRLDFPFPL